VIVVVRKGTAIKVSEEVKKKLDQLKHPGQSYDGVLRELLEKALKKVERKCVNSNQ
jgi:predicted CopG family antitoxin